MDTFLTKEKLSGGKVAIQCWRNLGWRTGLSDYARLQRIVAFTNASATGTSSGAFGINLSLERNETWPAKHGEDLPGNVTRKCSTG
jgi:hypothetical protein